MSVLHIAILSPFLFAIIVPYIYKRLRQIHTGWFVLLLPIILFIYFLQFLPQVKEGEGIVQSVSWIPSLNVDFTAKIDGLGLLFALLITGIGSLVVLYSIYYLSKDQEQLNAFYVYLLLFLGAMLGVVLSDNLIVLYTFWEFTSFSSFFLIGYWHHRERSRYGAQKSMLITVFGGLSLLGGIILLYIMTGTFSIQEMVANTSTIINHPLFLPAMIFILLGAFSKSAQFPFYIWLPDAMEAPTPVSAYLHSATMVKAGIYLVARMTPIFAYDANGYWVWLVGGVGIFTLFWGSFNAIKQTDLKGILAYSTVSQLGLIMSLLGVGAGAVHFGNDNQLFIVATIAAVFHLINHATFKGSLFMVAGIIDHETGTRDIRRLGGLMTIMPVSFTIAFIGTFSMAGIPPFNGFLSKEMFFTGMLRVVKMDIFRFDSIGFLFPVIAWIGSVFTFVYSMILLWKTFGGQVQREKLPKTPHEAPFGMLISPVILASLVVIFGFFPNILSDRIIAPAVETIMPMFAIDEIHISHWHGFQPELYMTIGVIIIGILLYLTLGKWTRIYQLFPNKLTLNQLYDVLLPSLETGSNMFIRTHMTGYIRTYLAYIFTFFIAILSFTMWSKHAFHFESTNLADIGLYEVLLFLAVIIGTVTILASKSRLTSIIALGAVGYAVSLFFVLFRAPDLALTQLVIETISVALFLLCFYFLPRNFHLEKTRFKLTNALISVGVGLVVTLIAISSYSTKLFPSISQYYVDHTYDPAGGENMVNVILVDFRGFDTLFEISVLAIAGLGVYGLIKLRLARRKEG
ncbi:Na+/H+ antiporter subunit A [Fervidibacillus halotolerans]|uniref:Na+/H+ antiporter subunit A n=1 Tax=Fervidibacillus halotolerans TaxID=2980027 RepID=A0A9E8LY29_9BACI|nr:Na+/H+ antiporter subunit A [Fervidibacillus halotolerans]WAA11830.1 Na+/H+ antiporter subunit A [Fervidibacillus halotolerans]